MRKKMLIIATFLIATLSLTGCSLFGSNDHQCQYSSEWKTDAQHHWHVCVECNKAGEKSDHRWDSGVVTTPATETALGVMTYTCLDCGYKKEADIPKTEHTTHNYDKKVVNDLYLKSGATCDSGAVYYYSCVCGEKGSNTFVFGDGTGHTFSKEWSYDETAHWHVATCGHDDKVSSFSAHQWNGGIITKQPSETEEGEKTFTCIICKSTKTESVPKLVHTHTYAETWTSDDTYHWHASTCGHEGETSGRAEHLWDKGTITTNPTLSSKGIKTFLCQVCKATKNEDVPKLEEEHFHVFDQLIPNQIYIATPATCTEKATYFKSCSCGLKGTETFEYGNANGHKYSGAWTYNDTHHWHAAICDHSTEKDEYNEHIWGAGVVTLEPTTISKGIRTFTCDTCGKTKTEEISKLEETHTHQYNQQNIDDQYLNSEATCFAKATYFYSCSCGQKGTTTFEHGNFANHKFTNYISNGNATCTKDGTRTAICDVCKIATDEITDVGSAKGHSFSEDWTSDDTHHWHASTCGHTSELSNKETHHWDEGVVTKKPTEIAEGEKTYTCDICHKTKVERIGKLDHIHTFASEYSFDDNYHWYSATCVHISEVKNKGSHSWNKGVIISQSTVYDEGIKLYTCQDCGHTKEETIDKIPSFTVVFFDSENRIISKNNYELNTASSQVVIPTIQEETGFQFEKWVNVYDSKSIEVIDFSQAQKDSVYKFKPSFIKIHDVIFIDYNGNQLGETLVVKDGDRLLKSDLPAIPFRDGYKSTWDEQILNTKITEMKIFEPIYEVLTFKVKFLDNKNGNLISTEIVEYGSFAIAPECELYQFISNKLCGFSGWKSSVTDKLVENVVGNKVIDVHSDLTLYADYGVSIEQPVLAAHIDGTIVTMSLCMPNGCSLYSANISMGWKTNEGMCEITGASISTVTPLNKDNCGEENCTVFTDKNDWLVYNNKAKTVDFIWSCGNGHSFSISTNVITLIFGVDNYAEINETIFSMLADSHIVYGKNGTDINDLKQSDIMVWFY